MEGESSVSDTWVRPPAPVPGPVSSTTGTLSSLHLSYSRNPPLSPFHTPTDLSPVPPPTSRVSLLGSEAEHVFHSTLTTTGDFTSYDPLLLRPRA